MNLTDIIQHLRSITSRTNFDVWVSVNITKLTDFFYTLSKEELLELNFDTEFYFGEFTRSAVFKEFEQSKNHSEPFDAFLFLLAVVAEKLAEHFGLVGTIEHLLSYLPESSVKYRLKALSQSQNIDNIQTDYIDFFPQILQLLQKAENLEVESHTQKLVDFLIYYFQKAEDKLKSRKYLAELKKLKEEFSSEKNIQQFYFLGHVSIQELIWGRYPHGLEVENRSSTVLYPSEIMETHFKYNINRPVLTHKDSEGVFVLMGYDKMTVLNDILDRGKTKFDEKYEGLEPNDKVLLYCYFNMKKHFFTSIAVFKKIWKSLHQIFADKKYSPIFIDLGCGPLTSGLALAELFQSETGEPLRINYIGIDISKAMIEKAKEFSQSDLFHNASTFSFFNSWNDIPDEMAIELAGKNNPFFINASYLFANLSVNIVEDLANFVSNLIAKFKNVHFIFQNPDRADRNESWLHFKKQLKFKEINADQKVEHVIYKTSRAIMREPGEEDVYYEILSFKA
jgi:SAM-dependent methyltransferase